ncbi:MAG TPA: sensor histidine kinase [Chiayiivirga sp.]|nr:sensor histidine kinase [Chiayiivirga sp.]
MSGARTYSLQARQLLAASLGLVAFLGLTGYALDRAFVDAADSSLRQRLQNYAWAYLSSTELSRNGDIIPPDTPPDARLARVGSGLYAAIIADNDHWESESALGRELPLDVVLRPGEERYEGPIETPTGAIYRQSMGMAWEVSDIKDVNVTVHVAESSAALDKQVAAFRRTLWVYLGAAGGLLLALQIGLLRWSLSPLRKLVADMVQVTLARKERLDGRYPQELDVLTSSLNELIEVGRDQITRTRNVLGDLAHSLKTPLAVVRSELDSGHDAGTIRVAVEEQVSRMNQIVAYQLSRAAATGHQTFSAPVPIVACAEEIVQSLEKVYASKNILCEFDVDDSASFYGERGDLMELLGNLLENAFKWAKHRVLLSVTTHTSAPQRRAGLLIKVEDDGPGIAPENVDRLLQRGVRGDERVHGHGIGLAIVLDLIHAYRGQLEVERSNDLGGACFVVRFNPAV